MVAYLAQQEGLSVEFIPYSPANLSEGLHFTRLLINKKLTEIQLIQNAQRRPGREQAQANNGIWLHTLLEASVVCMMVCPPGYAMRILHIPAAHLLRTYFDDQINESENVRQTFGIPLVYRPENPRFDFLKYEDDWSVYA
ncbi:MAG: hypothetical protein KBD50_00170 [Candidatus Pacebacteria bacterium]|nr:hypothetical protein [Candidatus Paceibacterota bacterium]